LPAPTFEQPAPPSITCNDQSLFLASAFGQEAWDARTGEQQWHVDQPGRSPGAERRIALGNQISTPDMVVLTETDSDSDPCRVSARSTGDGDTLWTSRLDGVGAGTFDLALGTDTLYVLPRDTNRYAEVVHAIPLT
jgi:hypothetical protein